MLDRLFLSSKERPYVLLRHAFQLSHHGVHGRRFARSWDPRNVYVGIGLPLDRRQGKDVEWLTDASPATFLDQLFN